jgi:hypothetical protein
MAGPTMREAAAAAGDAPVDVVLEELEAGAYARPLFSST